MSKLTKYDNYESLKNSKTAKPPAAKSSLMTEIEQFFKLIEQKLSDRKISRVKSKHA
jgi:hypothetical protein